MEMYKIENGILSPYNTLSEPYIRFLGRVYTNPNENTLRQAGYKTLVPDLVTDVPEGHYIQISYTEDETHIYEHISFIDPTMSEE